MLAISVETTEIYESEMKKAALRNSIANSENFSSSASVSVGTTSGKQGSVVSGNTLLDSRIVTTTFTGGSYYTVTTNDVLLGSSSATTWTTLDAFLGVDRAPSPIRPIQLSDSLADKIDRMLQDGTMDRKSFEILPSEPELFYHMGDLYDALVREMAELGMPSDCRIRTFSDPESTRGPMLVLECRVKNVRCPELIDIWKRLSLKLFEHTPREVRKRIAFTMDPV